MIRGRSRWRWWTGALVAILLLLASKTDVAALAHLGLRRSTPADSARVTAAPRELELTFTEAIDASLARLRLIGPAGADVPISALRQPDDSGQTLLADVRGPLDPGPYRLEWMVVGKDGHPVRGTISYIVLPGATGLEDPDRVDPPAGGEPGASVIAPGQEPMRHDSTTVPSRRSFDAESPGYVAVRALQFTALLIMIGVLAFAFVVLGLLRRTETDSALIATMRESAASIGFWASVGLLVIAGLRLYAQSLAMHGPGEALDGGYMAAMVASTVWGWGWLLHVMGSLVAIVGFRMARGHPSGWIAAAVGGLALAVTPALSGHAVATPGLGPQAVIADTLHVIGAAGWLGSLLLVLTVGIPVAMALGSDRRGATVARLVNAFSPTALIFAALVTLTGVFAAWLHAGFSSALWTSDYGRLLLIKVAMLSIVLATGAYNWLRVKPGLGTDGGAARLRRSATLELGVGLLVVIVTAALVATPPPRETDAGTASAAGSSTGRD